MNVYALLSLLASYACFLLGILVYQKDPKNELNKIFILVCVIFGYLAFVEFGYRQADTISAAHTWFKIGSVWPFSIAAYLHFFLVFTKSRVLHSKMTYFLLYGPAAIFSVIDLSTSLIMGVPRKEYWGWTYSIPENASVYTTTMVWAISLTVISLILVLGYFRRAEEPIEKQRIKFVLMGMLIPMVVGFSTEGVFPLTGIKIPELATIASAIGYGIITYGIYKYDFFVLTPAVVAEDIVAAMSNMLFLTQMDGRISLTNPSALHLLQYNESEITGKPLQILFPEQEWKKIKSNVAQIRNKETSFVTKDGEIIPVLVSTSVILDKDGNSVGILCVASDLRDHKQAEEAQRKEVLLREIHHRVKNNMQIVSSLLSLQSRYMENESYKQMFKESQNRIKSMALIHEKLYKSKTLETVNFREYITDLVQGLVQSYKGHNITVTIEVDDILLDVNTAVPCGLIINELVSNALKHAFPGREGEIKVGLHASNGTIELVVADNGVGIPEGVDMKATETLGLRLVTILAEDQLNGKIKLTQDGGTEFCITFQSK